ncbi:G protein-regulated inducer of neurite outgrowth 3 [Parus major]|uniref:G protein-regulated inducer of neurite outgrowth 3 n=1 Tax=Parus major TaxID=9157 RepID=UPI0007714FA6|nr:G protein-regulated inducer of neurite outgrowth 3 [Parus major]XP_015479407.1 G protein-regulated inducer of neurite outgrowth 3 [Parus major]XP_015479408.1 G protein-regulated inducer of neurite outgrowth 3 [Parus major]
MGTVPDPVRSAKLSLVSTAAEEEHLGDLQPAKHQPQPPSGERTSNGIPCTPSSSAGVCLFDLNCPGAASTQRCQQCHTNDDSQQEAFSPGVASTTAEGHPADVKPTGCSQPAGIQAPAAPALAAVGALLVGQGPEMMPAPQSSRQFVQGSQAKTSSLTQIEDSALKPQGADDQPALEVLNYSSPDDPVGVNKFCHTSQANLLQRGEKDRAAEKNGSAVCQSALPARQTAADLGRDPQTSLEANSGTADTAQLHPPDKTEAVQSSEAPAQSGHGSPHPVHSLDPMPGSANPTQLSKFKETGTMTAQPESSPFTQEAVSRTWRDAEVQAVATVESKSASTSPSIFAAFLKGKPPPEEKEELHVIYQGGMGQSQAALTDNLSSQQKYPSSPGITSKLTLVAVTASAQTQPVKLPGVPSDVASLVSADNAKPVLPCSPAAVTSQGTSVGDAEMTSTARDVKDAAQLPKDAPVPPKPIPAEQRGVDSSNHPPSQSGIDTGEPSTTSTDAVPKTQNKAQDLVPHAGSSRSPLLSGKDSEVKQQEVLGSSEQKPVQSNGASQGQASPNQSVVKPKEEDLVVLDSKGGLNVGSHPATGHAKACSQDAGEESRGHGDSGQSQMTGGQNLQAGLMPELSVSSATLAPPMAASAAPQQQGPQARESRHNLHTAVIPASSQAVPKLGENKKHSTPAMEAKVQVKQSKHVRDVVWDEQGMTWEVYGASLDPESLGIAIQNHLQRQIREHEKLIRAQNSQTRKSISSDTSSNKKLKGRQHNMFQSMLQNFRRPNCCVRPAPSSVLD